MNALSNAIQVLQSHCVNQPRCATCQFSQNGDKCKLTVHNVDNWDPTWGELLSLRKNFEVTEVCPHCDREITLIWDVDNDGYRVFCPSCGEEIMLCDVCLHADDNLGGKCDFKADFDGNPTCFRRREHKNKINN